MEANNIRTFVAGYSWPSDWVDDGRWTMTATMSFAGVRNGERGGRASLVSEAVQLLSREGIHGMSIGKLADRTGYSKEIGRAHV